MDTYYQVKLHWAKFLPKTDMMGTIDPFCVITSETSKGVVRFQTKCFPNNYHPKFKTTFVIPSKHANPNFGVEIRDKDDKIIMTTSESAARGVIQGTGTLYKTVIPLQQVSGQKVFKENGCLCVSVGKLWTYQGLKQYLLSTRPAGLVVDDKSMTLITPLAQQEVGFANHLALGFHFEPSQEIDIKVFELQPLAQQGKMLEIVIAKPGLKYKVKRELFKAPKQIGNLTTYAESKLDDLPFYYPLDQVQIYLSTVQPVVNQALDGIATKYGWQGTLSYQKAKTTLRNIFCDDKEEAVYFNEPYSFIKVDWDKNDVDMSHWLKQSAAQQGYVVDMFHHAGMKKDINVFSKPKKVGNDVAVMRVVLDDLPRPMYLKDLFVCVLKRQQVFTCPITRIVAMK